MAISHCQYRTESQKKNRNGIQGFTLIELVLVIVLLGIMAVGISGFITLSTQTYLNSSNRDEIIGNARFVIERLNRELRDAVPYSIRVISLGPSFDCVQFTPIEASGVYLDIPVAPEPASRVLSVIPFNDSAGDPYQCNAGCSDLVTIYPLNHDDIYDDATTDSGKIFSIESVDASVDPWQLNISNDDDIVFDEDSPTKRFYITNEQVSYCAFSEFIIRFNGDISDGATSIPGRVRHHMAGYLVADYGGRPPFTYLAPTLRRNAVVQLHLQFTRGGENYVFDHDVHLNNVP
jgi:MSHA biogenesis protein MshO